MPTRQETPAASTADAAAAAVEATIARLRLPQETKPFVPYEDDYDQEDGEGGCLWLRGAAEG
jgi:hypothetical protein